MHKKIKANMALIARKFSCSLILPFIVMLLSFSPAHAQQLQFMSASGEISDAPVSCQVFHGWSKILNRYSNMPPQGWRFPTISDLNYISNNYPSFSFGNILIGLKYEPTPRGWAYVTANCVYKSYDGWQNISFVIGSLRNGSPSDPIEDPNGNYSDALNSVKIMFVRDKY